MVVLHVKSAAPASASSSSSSAPAQDGDVADVAAALLSLCRRLRARCAGAGDAATGELERALDEAEAYASKEQVLRNRFLSPRALREHIRNIEKKCATALQEPPEALSLQESSSGNKHERIQIWWAGKELAMDQKLSDYIGVNDKTKIVIRLTQARDEC
ncbi:uncharacterized protein [Miscanthus floridulus]|uniref:uncharacterized protein n=1 Tax=Miscanthus floridulus TaxID=154761 RepID=UPI003459F1D7